MDDAGKDPINGPEHLKMIHGGKVLDNTKTFEGVSPYAWASAN